MKIDFSHPANCAWILFGAPALARPGIGIIFGWAGGSSDYSLRLPPEIRRDAIAAGGVTTSKYSAGDVLDLGENRPGLDLWEISKLRE